MKKNFITTKYLRNNMQSVINQIQNENQEIVVYYRSLPAFTISPFAPRRRLSDTKVDNIIKKLTSLELKKDKNDLKLKKILDKHGSHIS